MSFLIQKAQRSKSKMRLALCGPSGSGKTYSALLLASGMAKWGKVCLIDTEHGSGQLYSGLGDYSVITLEPPFSPERYIEAIKTAEDAGMEVIVIDSMTHEWDGTGGILDIHSNLPGNSFTNWGKLTPRHNKFIENILQSPAHVICTLRTKQDYVLQEKNGKQVPEKVGLKAVTRDGVDYEFTLVFDLDIKHNATTSKDRTGLFDKMPDFLITKEIGEKIRDWSDDGIDPNAPATKKQVEEIVKVSESIGILENEVREGIVKKYGVELEKIKKIEADKMIHQLIERQNKIRGSVH